MEIYRGIEQFEKIANAVVTSGTFDGVHIGHQTIIKRLNTTAKKLRGESVLLTFYPHPRMVLQEDTDLKLITTIDERIELLRNAGLQHLIIHPFTKEFSRTTSLEFVRNILVDQLGTKKLVIGYNHHFGRNREGSFEHLKEYSSLYGFEVEEISAQEIDEVNVSSTKIRKALVEGDVKMANAYLGHSFRLQGKVVKGNQLGRKLGFPTANIEIENKHKLIPAKGVYAIRAKLGEEEFPGMLNIGVRPTINEESNELSVEAHLFDFKEEIYGSELSLSLMHRIRDEKKFSSLEDLMKEMKKDESKAKNLLS